MIAQVFNWKEPKIDRWFDTSHKLEIWSSLKGNCHTSLVQKVPLNLVTSVVAGIM